MKKVGKGTAVFLNFFLDSYPQRRKVGAEEPMRRLVKNLLLLRDVQPAVRVDVQADPKPHMFTVRYTSGEARYVATLMPHEDKTADWSAAVDVTFPQDGYVYDVRKRRALGRVQSVRTTLLAGEPTLAQPASRPGRMNRSRARIKVSALRPGGGPARRWRAGGPD